MDTFSYPLPEEKIAQRPLHPPHDARLMLVDRASEKISESTFWHIGKQLLPSDILVFNDTKVVPARILAEITGKPIEIFLVEEISRGSWRAIGRPMKLLRQNVTALLRNGLRAHISQHGERELLVNFEDQEQRSAGREQIFSVGLMPIPPYIREGLSDDQDLLDYQTFFAKIEGSVAAPTASLHFTEALVSGLRSQNITVEFVTLHVGLASILGLGKERPASEKFIFDRETFKRLQSYRQQGRRIVAVGTTVVRALESFARSETGSSSSETDLFITPGFEFRLVDALVTNFHMPETTHLLLVEAFMRSRPLLAASYAYALNNGFRFLSYGDGMLIS